MGEQLGGDGVLEDGRRPAGHHGGDGVAMEPLDGEVEGGAVTAGEDHGLEGDLGQHGAAGQLGQADLEGVGESALGGGGGGPVGEQPVGFDVEPHLDQRVVGGLELNDVLAEGLALLAVGDRLVVGRFGEGQAVRRVVDPFHVEGAHQLGEAAGPGDHVLLGDVAVGEVHLAVGDAPGADEVGAPLEAQPRHPLLHHDRADALGARDPVEADGRGVELVDGAAGDEPLRAVDDVLVAVEHGAGLEMREVGAVGRFGEGDAAGLAASDDVGEELGPGGLVVGEEDERRAGPRRAEGRLAGDPVLRLAEQLLDDDDVVEGGELLAAVAGRHGQAEEAVLGDGGDDVVVRGLVVSVPPGPLVAPPKPGLPGAVPQFLLGRGELEVHDSPLVVRQDVGADTSGAGRRSRTGLRA